MNTRADAPDRCPRCGGAFACGAAGPGPCACTTVTLGAALQAQLRAQFQGCLCLACLQALAQADSAAAHATPAVTGDAARSPPAPVPSAPPEVGGLARSQGAA